MIVREVPGDRDLLLVGVVRGLSGEAPKAVEALEAFRPNAVGLGLTETETESLRTHFIGTPTEPVVPLAPSETVEARALVRYGEVSVPHPAFIALMEWGVRHKIPVEGIDPEEEVQAELFVAHIGYFELVRRTVRERRTGRSPPEAPDADAFALAWDRSVHPGKGSERYALARERAMLEGLKELREGRRRLAVVVDRERVDRLASVVGAAGSPAS